MKIVKSGRGYLTTKREGDTLGAAFSECFVTAMVDCFSAVLAARGEV